MNRIKLGVLTCVFMLLLGHVSLFQAQALPVYLLNDNQLESVDAQTGSREVLLSHVIPEELARNTTLNRRVWRADIDSNGEVLYLIEVWGRSERRESLGLPTASEFVKVDVATGERQVLYNRYPVFNFSLSQNNRYAVVFYHVGDFFTSRISACVMDLLTELCDILNLDGLSVGSDAIWIDDETFTVLVADANPVRIVDATTRTYETVVFPPEWYIYSVAPVPQTNSLIAAADLRDRPAQAISFLLFDRLTENVQEVSYTALNASQGYLAISTMTFSPNGRFLLYEGSNYALVEFGSGRLVNEFSGVSKAAWIDNETVVIQREVSPQNYEVIQVSASSGEVTTLLQGANAEGLLLFR